MVCLGAFTVCWGHEITDHLRGLWFYFDKRFAHLKKLKIAFVLSFWTAQTPPSQNFWQLLESLGIPREKFLLIDKPTRFARVFVPDACFGMVDKKYCYTQEFVNLINRLPNLQPPENVNIEKVYFSRLAFQSPKDFNEIELENLFYNQGFSIIYPEQLDFLSQLAILQNCTIFAATDGSIAHNSLFLKPGTRTIICRKTRHFTAHQIIINHLKNLDVTYIDAAFSPFAKWRKVWEAGPFFLYETKALRRFFGLPPKHFPFLKFLKYFCVNLPAFLNNELLVWTHPIRGKLKLGTHLRHFLKIFKR